MLHNKKGAALLQVLLVTVVLAGMATMLLRASLSRTTTARQTRRAVASQMLINSCQAEVSAMWAIKSPERFAQDLAGCWMYCKCSPKAEEVYALQQAANAAGATNNDKIQYIAARYGETAAQTCQMYGVSAEQCTAAQTAATNEGTEITPCQCAGANASRNYTCTPVVIGEGTSAITYTIKATFTGTAPNSDGQCAVSYTLEDNSGNMEVVL